MLEINFSPFPELETNRLILRSLDMRDVQAIYKLRSNPEVMKHINRPLIKSIEEAEAWVELVTGNVVNNIGITWAMCLKTDPEVNFGNIGLWRIEPENYRAEVGYMMLPAYQKKGLMFEALKTVTEFGISNLKLHSIEARIDPLNTASSKLLKRAGFVREAYFIENIFWNGNFEDTAIYSFVKK